jgi:rod shape-determining protein MreD
MRPLSFVLVWFTLSVALLLTVVRLPPEAPALLGWLRPDWVALVMLYWVMAIPQQVGMGTAWAAGLLVDSVTGNLLGQHALALVFIAWAGLSLYERLRMYSLLQQAVIVFVTVALAQLLDATIEYLARGAAPWTPLLLLPALVSALCWAPMFVVLRALRRRFSVA